MKRLNTVSAVALMCAAAPALAEMDARETWAQWQQDYLRGVQITAAQSEETETAVLLTDVVFSVGDPDDGFTVSVPGLTIVETDDGGVVATISGNTAYRMVDARFDETRDIVGLDLTTDGASLTVVEGDSLLVAFAAPALGGVLTEAVERGQPMALTASFSVNNVAMRYSDTMFSELTRVIDVSGGFDALTSVTNGTDLDDIAQLDGHLDVASWSFDATLDAPMDMLDNFFVPDGRLISDMVFALGASSMSFNLVPADENSYTPDFAMAFSLAGLDLAHDVFVPLDEREYFNGQDLVSDDLVGFVDYALTGLEGTFSSLDEYDFGDSQTREQASFAMSPTTLSGRIAIDDEGMLTRSVTGMLGMEFAFEESWGDGDAVDVSGVNFRIVDLATEQLATVPLDNAMMAFMQGLPEGLSWRESYSMAEFGFEYAESYDQGSEWAYASSAGGTASDVALTIDLSQTRVNAALGLAAAAGSFLEDGMPVPAEGSLLDLAVDFSMPMNTGAGSEPYNLTLGLGELILGDALWQMADPQGMLDHGPVSAQIEANGLMRATTNPMALATFGIGMSPFVAENLSFNMAVAAVGATVQGVGDFATERAIAEGAPPVGSADFSATGIDDVLAAMQALGAIGSAELEEAQFLLEAFTSTDADGTRRMQVEINDEEHLIVNGQRMQ